MTETRAPATSDHVASLLAEIADDFRDRVHKGEDPDVEVYAAEYPALADVLRQVLPALQILRSGTGAAHEVSGDPPTGILGDFRILREVGHGGMGIVYEAEQLSLNRRVALKVLPFAATMDPKQLMRFHNEAKAAASLRHEHIVHVYGVGCERGVHYFAMEFIEGATLAQVIAAMRPASRERQRPEEQTVDFTPVADAPGSPNCDTAPVAALSTKLTGNDRGRYRAVAALIADAADALEYAHSMGIIHRDVKPGNLMVDAAGRLWVADFGLARLGPDAGLTMSGDLLGTLRYMAPEQALARHGLADHRVDVYGLGCTLYELLTGRPAVGGTEKADIFRHLSFEEPVALRKLDKAIPAELETIALKCLAKNPNERYTTAGDLAADLRRFLDDKPIKAKPPGPHERVVRWVRRNRALTASAAIALTVALLATAGSIGYVLSEHASRLALTEQNAQAALTAARTAIEANDPALAGRKVSEARGQLGGDGPALAGVASEIDRVQAEIDARLNDAARFQRFLKLAEDALDRMGFGDPFGDFRIAVEALAIYGVLEGGDWLQRVQHSTLTAGQKRQVRDVAYITLVTLADLVRSKGAEGSDAPNRSLDLLKQAETFHEPTRALYFVRAECYRRQGNRAAADAEDNRSATAPAQTAWDHYLPGRTIQLRAGVTRKHGRRLSGQASKDLDGAIHAYRDALVTQPSHYNALFFLAQCLEWKENYAEAAGLFSACLAVGPVQGRADVYAHRSWCFRHMGQAAAADADYATALATDADSAKYHFWLVFALDEQGRFDDELTVLRRVISLTPKDSEGRRDLAVAHRKLGDTLEALGRREEAVAAYRQAIELAPDWSAAFWSETYMNLGQVLTKLGRHTEAETALRRAIEWNPNLSQAHMDLGGILAELRRYPDAEAACRRAIELDPNSKPAFYNLGFTLAGMQRFPEAEAAYRRAIELAPDDANGHQGLGRSLGEQKRHAEAEVAFRRAIELEPDDAEARYSLGVTLESQGKHPEAEVVFRRAIELKPDFAEAHNNLGFVLLKQGKHPEAETAFRHAIKLKPDDVEARNNLGVTLTRQGKLVDAAAAYRRVLELKPHHPQALNGLSWLLATCPDPSLRDAARAVELARKAVAQAPNDGALHNTLGVAQYRAGNWKEAVAVLGISMELRNGGDSSDWFFLAMAHWQLGDREQSRKDFARAAAWMDMNMPQDAELRRFRAEAAELLGIKESPAATKPPPKP